MRIAVIGANGQLGIDVCRAFEDHMKTVIPFNHEQIEISDSVSVGRAVEQARPDFVINTAAMHQVEACEKDPLTSYAVNGLGAYHLASVCSERRIPFIHISTDYVFDGGKQAPYVENDLPLPLNVYGNTKLSGEHFIRSASDRFYILRVSGIYGLNRCRAKGENFVNFMLRLAGERKEVRVVDDEILTPTFTEDIAGQIVRMTAAEPPPGIYHATAEGACSWYEFASEIFALSNSRVRLNKAAPGEFPVKVNRPKYSVLENKALKDQNLNVMRHWKDGLKEMLDKLQATEAVKG